jgi:hypothetical protein
MSRRHMTGVTSSSSILSCHCQPAETRLDGVARLAMEYSLRQRVSVLQAAEAQSRSSRVAQP